MRNKNFCPDEKQSDTTQHFRPFPGALANHAAKPHPEQGHHERDKADRRKRDGDVVAKEREGDADSRGVHARSHRCRDDGPDGRVHEACRLFLGGEAFPDHAQPQKTKDQERYPMIVSFYCAGELKSQQLAQKRRQRFERPEAKRNQGDPSKRHARIARAFRNRRRERVSRQAESQYGRL